MLDFGASTNDDLEIMCELGSQITKPYKNVQVVDGREIQVCGVIKDLQVHLHVCPLKVPTMECGGDRLSCEVGHAPIKEVGSDDGGNIQMDWSHADIPITPTHKVRLFREQNMLHHVEDPRQLDNEPLYPEVDKLELGAYIIHI
jgi:hypothetical protein